MKDLESFRRQIDAIDDRLLALLGERFAVVREVAAYKAPRGIPVVIPERVAQVRERCADEAPRHGLEPELGHDADADPAVLSLHFSLAGAHDRARRAGSYRDA